MKLFSMVSLIILLLGFSPLQAMQEATGAVDITTEEEDDDDGFAIIVFNKKPISPRVSNISYISSGIPSPLAPMPSPSTPATLATLDSLFQTPSSVAVSLSPPPTPPTPNSDVIQPIHRPPLSSLMTLNGSPRGSSQSQRRPSNPPSMTTKLLPPEKSCFSWLSKYLCCCCTSKSKVQTK